MRELLTHMPASVKSEQPTNPNYAITKDLASESNLTALHLAAYSGSENVVRTLLNSSGVDVEGGCSPSVSDYDHGLFFMRALPSGTPPPPHCTTQQAPTQIILAHIRVKVESGILTFISYEFYMYCIVVLPLKLL